MPDSWTQGYTISADRLFALAVQTVSELGYSVLHSDTAGRIVSFNTGFSMRSMAGQDMTVTVSRDPEGSTLILSGKRAQRNAIGGQLFDWGEKGSIADKYLQHLDDLVGEQEDELDEAPSGAAGLVDELERLARLHGSGALSDFEFAAAKTRLLA